MKKWLEQNQADFHNYLQQWLKTYPFGASWQPAAEYLLAQPGKLLRPALVLSIARELGMPEKNYQHLALAVELHHTYTLVHDDLPCMDDDDMRRGRPSLHKKYDEATALLVGDMLLGKSFEILSHIEHPQLPLLLKIFAHATGSKGLILGQKLDLAQDAAFARIFELKTARLFQCSFLMAAMLAQTEKKFSFGNVKNFWHLGTASGMLFQLIDDYQDREKPEEQSLNIFTANILLAKQLVSKFEARFHQISQKLHPVLPKTLQELSQFLMGKIIF